MTIETRILDRVTKLLRLSKSDNANEAATAAAMAQGLIDRFRLDQAVVDLAMAEEAARPEEEIQSFSSPLDATKRIQAWRARLAMAIAAANQCLVFSSPGLGLKLVGGASDAETVRYMFDYLANEVDRLANRDARGEGRSWANNYRLGVVQAISEKLKAQKKESRESFRAESFATAGESAMVRVESALARVEARGLAVKAWADKAFKLRYSNAKPVNNFNAEAREAGRRAGASVVIGGSKAGLGSGLRGLGA